MRHCVHCGYQSGLAFLPRCPRCSQYMSDGPHPVGGMLTTDDLPVTPIIAPHAQIVAAPPTLSIVGDPVEISPTTSRKSQLVRITDVQTEMILRLTTGIEPLDRVLGGGIVPGFSYLISGGPGAGKSTLLQQMLHFARRPDGESCPRLMWGTSEERVDHVAMRAQRVHAWSDRNWVIRESCIEILLESMRELDPDLVVIDSIQTIFTGKIPSAPGSVAQVHACAQALDAYAKETGHPIFLISQVNKDGDSTGPNALRHLVDCLLLIDGNDKISRMRTLTSTKNRQGDTTEVGYFEMHPDGLRPSERGSEVNEQPKDEFLPVAQELLYRVIELGGEIDASLRDRIGGRLDLVPRGSR